MERLSESHTLKFCFKKDQRAEVVAGAEWRRTKVFFFLITFFFLRRNTDVFVGWWEQHGREGEV